MENKKIKILIVAWKYFPASGGSASYTYNMAMGLHRQGYDILLLAPKYKHRDVDDTASPFKIKRLPFIRKQKGMDIFNRIIIASVLLLIEFILFKPDVVWATSFAGCRTLGMLTFLKTGFIGTIHGGGVHRRYPSKSLTNKITDHLGLRFINRADAIATVSEDAKKVITNKIPSESFLNKTRVIYNSLEFDESKFYSYKDALGELPQFKNKKVILTVGRLVSAKGHDVVIQSLKKLKKIFPDIIYIIVGEGVKRESLQQIVREDNLENSVIFAGYVSEKELEMYYAICDIFVMAGRWTPEFIEGFGLVYIEAGLRGKAVIGTRVGGIPEAIVDGKTGYVIEPENPEELAGKIEYLLKNKKVRKHMGEYAVKFLKVNYSNEVMAGYNSNLIRDVLGKD